MARGWWMGVVDEAFVRVVERERERESIGDSCEREYNNVNEVEVR